MADDELEEDITGNGNGIKLEDFFHGQMDQLKADELLNQYEPDNYYLVRERVITESSEKPDEQFCISLHTRVNGQPKKVHFRIRQSYDLCVIGGLVFHSLSELVTYYTQVEIYPGGRLEHPIRPKHSCPSNRCVMAIMNYTKSAGTDELSLTAGDVCQVQHKNQDGWMWVAHVKSAQSGWVYDGMVEDLNSPNYDPELESCEFYHPSHREERVEELKSRPTGTYFLRPSAKSRSVSVLCVNCNDAIKKFEIERIPGGFNLSGKAFRTIDEVIQRYSVKYIDEKNEVKLREPLLRRSHAASNLPQEDIYAPNRASSTQIRECQLAAEFHCLFPKRRSRQRAWKRQRCILHRRQDENHEVLITSSSEVGRQPKGKPKGLIALEFAHLYPVCHGAYDRPHCLQLVIFNEVSANSTPPDVYVLAADSQAVLAEWLAALKPLCKCSKVCNHGQRSGHVRHVSTLEVAVKGVRNLNVSCKTAFVAVHFNGVVVAKTRSNRREQDDDSVLNWDEQFHFEFFPECIHTLSLHMTRRKTPKTTKVMKHDVRVSDLSLGRTSDFKVPAAQDKLQLCFSVRRVGYAVLQASKDYVPIRDIFLKSKDDPTECLRALAEVCTSEDLTYLARAIYKVFAYYDQVANLLTSLLLREIQSISCESEGVLFRTTTIGTSVLEVYLVTDEPMQFVRHCLGEMVQEIVNSNANLELKADRLLHSSGEMSDLDEADSIARRNAARLIELLNSCMRRTLRHCQANGCPAILHQVSVACQQETTRRFPQATARVLSAFFFLRLFCPALTTKFRQVFGAELHQEVSPQVLRSLQLAAKALQLFANQSKTMREACMELVRPFVCENTDLFNQLNTCLTASPDPVAPFSAGSSADAPSSSSAGAAAAAASSSPSDLQNISLTFELASVHDFCARHLDDLRNLQTRSGSQNLNTLIKATEFLSNRLSNETNR
ncbi:hypothetical protein BOX15_Mlig005008g1 [Macrostomum lignano]|uniref:Ras GTPase-activating protein 1 n=1 Tax=Macrostomum lignano TaxID=282301 RepID=A0A267F209_9PLAT|nr:hypothetical protein BOX15_Mlig005008g1 [Macrostomum lignano]